MKAIILPQKIDVFKKITAVLLAIWVINPFYTLYFNWFLYAKILVILLLLGFEKKYRFSDSGDQMLLVSFLKINVFKTRIFKKDIDYLSVFKTTNSSRFSLKVFQNKKAKVIYTSKNYDQIIKLGTQISACLNVQFFNPFEDYETY